MISSSSIDHSGFFNLDRADDCQMYPDHLRLLTSTTFLTESRPLATDMAEAVPVPVSDVQMS